jgi:hypothetical protein
MGLTVGGAAVAVVFDMGVNLLSKILGPGGVGQCVCLRRWTSIKANGVPRRVTRVAITPNGPSLLIETGVQRPQKGVHEGEEWFAQSYRHVGRLEHSHLRVGFKRVPSRTQFMERGRPAP